MTKMLLIVDPQIDFITGSLPVPGASEAMDKLSKYVIEHNDDYTVRIVTSDWHPYNHCSFSRKGGPWPSHCVQHSVGAAIWQPLVDALNLSRGGYTLLYKGTRVDKEEYSIMQNADSTTVIIRLINALKIGQIDLCGLAGNVCVLNTAKDLIAIFGSEKLHILTGYTPSLDDGTELKDFITSNGLS
ncbi:MAG: isochorismatase family protein [Prevotella sp.]|nr:isochorismatase family protein [Prevotella sp.]MDD3387867.1 isochorismatase family protein [Prevotella sp.]